MTVAKWTIQFHFCGYSVRCERKGIRCSQCYALSLSSKTPNWLRLFQSLGMCVRPIRAYSLDARVMHRRESKHWMRRSDETYVACGGAACHHLQTFPYNSFGLGGEFDTSSGIIPSIQYTRTFMEYIFQYFLLECRTITNFFVDEKCFVTEEFQAFLQYTL